MHDRGLRPISMHKSLVSTENGFRQMINYIIKRLLLLLINNIKNMLEIILKSYII